MLKKTLAFLLVVLIFASLLSACSNDKSPVSEPPVSSQPTAAPSATPQPTVESGFKLPITDEKTDVSIWESYILATGMTDMNEGAVWIEAEKRTNIHLTWTMASATNAQESYNLLLASQNYPDIINVGTNFITGGLDQLVEDDVAIDLIDKLDTHAPNYQRWRNSDPQIARDTITDSGRVVGFSVLLDQLQASYYGPVLRQDLLDKVGYNKLPETYDDWTEMLRALKGEVDVAPYYTNSIIGCDTSILSGLGFDQTLWQLNESGKVTYAPLEENWKYYLKLMSGWYNEGLLDPDWPTDASALIGKYDVALTNDHAAYGTFFTMIPAFESQTSVEGYSLTPVAPPVLNNGDERKIHLLQVSTSKIKDGISIITTQVSDFETVCKWLDYWYTDEGILLAGYGIEGETFHFNDKGEPKLNEIVANNPEMAMFDSQTYYTAFAFWSTVYSWKREWHDWMSPKSIEACLTWDKNYNNLLTFPQPASLTTEESAQFSSIMGDVTTYINEKTAIFLAGNYTEEAYNEMVSQLKKMNIDKAIALKQAALDRYNTR